MRDRLENRDKKRGVVYAVAIDGHELPVIDVTHPAFALLDEEKMKRQVARFSRGEKLRDKVPTFVQRAVLGALARRSRLARALYHAREGVISGMTLYVAKLGPDMLGPAYANAIDRGIAAAPPSRLSRARLEDTALLLAEGLRPLLRAKPGRPVHLFNIAGGPGADSWNALIVLQKEERAMLEGRTITIHVLDPDTEGPTFGARAIAALRSADGPLADVDVQFRHVVYDWSDPTHLRALLSEANGPDGVLAVSSEGGLFEYGSNDDIVENLAAIRDAGPDDATVVGSVTRADGPIEFLRHFTVKPRTMAAFRALAERGGWNIATHIERPLSYDVRLSRA
jgi:hypothetical protein